MNRRIMLMSFSAAAVPLLAESVIKPALAQAAAAPTDMQSYKMMTLQYGTLSKETSQLALQRAHNARVKEFAGFEFAEQTTVSQVLIDEQNPTPPTLTSTNAAILQKLRGMQAGPAFDREYVTNQLQVHQQLLAIQDSFLKSQNTMGSDSVHVAMLARTAINMHITMLNDIHGMLRA